MHMPAKRRLAFQSRIVQMPRKYSCAIGLKRDEKMISYLDRTCRIEIEPIRKIGQLEEDVLLCSFDKVQNTVEKLIQNGYIRRVYALRFGYCCYRDVERGKCALSGVAD